MFNFKNPFKKEEEKKEEVKIEDSIFNPLKVYCGDFVEVNTIDESLTFTVSEIIEYSRILSEITFKFTDYRLEDNDKVWILRLNPTKSISLVNDSKDCDILLMKLFFEGEFEEGIQAAAKCKEFNKHNEDGTKISYYALHAGENGYKSNLKVISLPKNINHKTIKYWDFYRDPNIELGELFAGQVFLFVEIDQNDGFITMWEGHVIFNSDIKTYRKN